MLEDVSSLVLQMVDEEGNLYVGNKDVGIVS